METVTKEIQKRQHKTDGQAYLLKDSGCDLASQCLGEPSKCLECPFGKCIMDIPGRLRQSKSFNLEEFIAKELIGSLSASEDNIKGGELPGNLFRAKEAVAK